MSSHPDADAFVRAILNDPAEVTTRLAFADWLEETGDPANADWGAYIRLMTDADAYPPGSFERENCRWRATNLPVGIGATLEIDAGLFVAHSQPLRQLLPAHRFRVILGEYTPPRPALEAVSLLTSFFSRILPLAFDDRVLLLAVRDPEDWDVLGSLEFSLGRELVAVGAAAGELAHAINRHYGGFEDEPMRAFIADLIERAAEFTQPPPRRPTVPDPPYFRLDLDPGI